MQYSRTALNYNRRAKKKPEIKIKKKDPLNIILVVLLIVVVVVWFVLK